MTDHSIPAAVDATFDTIRQTADQLVLSLKGLDQAQLGEQRANLEHAVEILVAATEKVCIICKHTNEDAQKQANETKAYHEALTTLLTDQKAERNGLTKATAELKTVRDALSKALALSQADLAGEAKNHQAITSRQSHLNGEQARLIETLNKQVGSLQSEREYLSNVASDMKVIRNDLLKEIKAEHDILVQRAAAMKATHLGVFNMVADMKVQHDTIAETAADLKATNRTLTEQVFLLNTQTMNPKHASNRLRGTVSCNDLNHASFRQFHERTVASKQDEIIRLYTDLHIARRAMESKQDEIQQLQHELTRTRDALTAKDREASRLEASCQTLRTMYKGVEFHRDDVVRHHMELCDRLLDPTHYDQFLSTHKAMMEAQTEELVKKVSVRTRIKKVFRRT